MAKRKEKKQKVMSLTLDRSRWTEGSLLACEGGQAHYCAVGGYLLALGVDGAKIQDKSTVPQVREYVPKEGAWLLGRPSFDATSADVGSIYGASDDRQEREVIRIFNKHGIKVKYVGEYECPSEEL